MKGGVYFLILGVLMGVSEVAGAERGAELGKVAAELRGVLEKLEPKAEITYPEGSSSLVISYLSQPFKIHGRSMTGEISLEAHDDVGPSFKGFVLKVHLQEKGEVNQAVVPQTLQEPYWRTDLNVTVLGGTAKQVFWGLSYGSRTDKELLARITQVLNGLKGEGK